MNAVRIGWRAHARPASRAAAVAVAVAVAGALLTGIPVVPGQGAKPANAAPATNRISTTTGGTQAEGISPVISANGLFATFVSNSSAMPSNPNGLDAVYWKDLTLGTVKLVSVNLSGGVTAGSSSEDPVISDNGQFVAFDSDAFDLISGDTNGVRDVFVRDMAANTTTTLVSVSASGAIGNDWSNIPSISSDGNRISFNSQASNLAPGEGANQQVFLRDRAANTTTKLSPLPPGDRNAQVDCDFYGNCYALWDGKAGSQAISGDGRYVVLRGNWERDTNGISCGFTGYEHFDYYAYDTKTQVMTRLTPVASVCDGRPAISSDGSTVVGPITSRPNGSSLPQYWFMTPTGAQIGQINPAISGSANGGECWGGATWGGFSPCGISNTPAINSNGYRISFSGAASNLVANDNNNAVDVFYLDRAGGGSQLASPNTSGTFANGNSTAPSVRADGTGIAFASGASDLITLGQDTNNASDAFTRTGLPTPAIPPTNLAAANLDGGGPEAAGYCRTCSTPNEQYVKPVDAATGNFWHTFDDLSIPGRGIPLQMSHTYNSRAASAPGAPAGVLGFGWTFPYNMSLTLGPLSPPSTVTVNQENGSQVPFTWNGGAYAAPSWVTATLVNNADGTFTFTRHLRETFTFNASGQLTSETGLNPEKTGLTYTGSQLTQVTEDTHYPGARALTFTYPTNQVKVTDPAGRWVLFQKDASANLTDVTDVAGGNWHFTYDGSHRMLTMRDPRGNTTTNHYDASGKVDWQKDELQRQTLFSYTGDNASTSGGTTTITDPAGNVTVQAFSGLVMTSQTQGSGTPQQAVWQYTADPATLGASKVIDPNLQVTQTTYNSQGLPTVVIDPLGRVTKSTYDGSNNLLAVTDPRGVTTTMTYDTGNLTSRSAPLLDVNGSVIATQATQYSIDTTQARYGDVLTVTDPSNRAWHYTYDDNGNLKTETDSMATPDTTAHCYDSIGRLTETMNPKGSSGFACPTPAVPANYATVFSYDNFGDTTKVTDGLSHSTTNTYDADRNLLTTTDPKGNVNTYTYDAAGQRTSQIAPDATTTTYGYDLAGNRNLVTAPAASALSDGFNRANGALGSAETGQSWQTITGAPGVTGNQFWASTAANAWAYANAGSGLNDASVRATTKLSATPGSSPFLILRAVNSTTWLYVYLSTATNQVGLDKDQGGTYSALSTVNYTLSPGGTYTVSATMSGPNVTVVINGAPVLSYTLSAADQTTYAAATQHGLGINVSGTDQSVRWDDFTVSPLKSTSYTYDPLNRLKSETDPLPRDADPLPRTTTYTYDKLSNLQTKQDPGGSCAAPVTGCTTYGYDFDNELKSVSYSDTPAQNVTNVDYDPDGQRTAMSDGTGTSNWTWDSLHRMTSSQNGTGGASAVSYTYDLANRALTTTTGATKTVSRTYDAAGRPQTVQDWLSHTTTYASDPDGNLASATTPVGAQSQVDSWGYDPADQLTSSTFKTGATTLGALTYGRDANGGVGSQAESGTGLPAAVTHTYGYDARNRLAQDSITAPAGSAVTNGYDQANDLTQQAAGPSYTVGGGPRQGFDNANELCFQSSSPSTGTCASPPQGATTFGYDSRGNRTSVTRAGLPGTALSYDQANRLTQVAPTAASGNQGQYTPLQPARILDTRSGSRVGTCPGTTCATIGAGQTLTVKVAGQGGVPATGAAAVAVTANVQNATAASWLMAYASDDPRPSGNTLAWNAGEAATNLIVVKIGADGNINLYNPTGTVDVVLDVAGWYAASAGDAGSGFNAMNSVRILDTRPATRTGTCPPGGSCVTLAAGTTTKVQVSGQGGIPSTGVAAAAINFSLLNPSGGGYLTVWPSDQTRPGAAQLNFAPGDARSTLVTAKLAADGTISIYNGSNGTVDLTGDLQGWFGGASGALFQPLNNVRLLDTRAAPLKVGTCPNGCQQLTAGSSLTLHVAGKGGIPSTGATAATVSVTAVPGAGAGTLTLWPGDAPRPATTSLTFVANHTTTNSTDVKLAADGTLSVYASGGPVDITVEVEGFYVQAAPTSTYTYNGDGLRMSKTVNGTTSPFAWDPSGGLPQLLSDGAFTYVYGPDGAPIEQVDTAGNVTWLHHDQEASTRLLTNSTGAVVGAAAYDPYGQLLYRSGTSSSLGYAGQYTDAETGFQYLRTRYYDPATAEFISRDPAADDTHAPYGYAADSPLNATDPSGLFCVGTDLLGHLCTSDSDVIHTYHPERPDGKGYAFNEPVKLRYGYNSFPDNKGYGYRHVAGKHGIYFGALRETLDHPDSINPKSLDPNSKMSRRYDLYKCFTFAGETETYHVVIDFNQRDGHTLSVVTAYWEGYHGYDAPWWAIAYRLE